MVRRVSSYTGTEGSKNHASKPKLKTRQNRRFTPRQSVAKRRATGTDSEIQGNSSYPLLRKTVFIRAVVC